MNYLGLMSGTSADGIDAVMISFPEQGPAALHAASHIAYPAPVRRAIEALRDRSGAPQNGARTVQTLGELDTAIGETFAEAANALLTQAGVSAKDVHAIGSHGQTIAHHPAGDHPFSLQLGNAAVIAERTGITTVANFRARDIAAGGHGAPLVPAFHNFMFRSTRATRAIVNIGGIANVSLLAADPKAPVLGFDTGPGNTLLDVWIGHQQGKTHDDEGSWAASGQITRELLERLLADPFFKTAPPKSTGQEYFNLSWIKNGLRHLHHVPRPEDVQATLTALTTETIAQALSGLVPVPTEVYLCGGGVHNRHLVSLLEKRLDGSLAGTTAALGMDPDWVEAAAFAWLAHRTLEGMPGNLPTVTGAAHPAVLGAIYKA